MKDGLTLRNKISPLPMNFGAFMAENFIQCLERLCCKGFSKGELRFNVFATCFVSACPG
jgi:hypothetical protein